MKKSIRIFFIYCVAAACAFSFSACNKAENIAQDSSVTASEENKTTASEIQSENEMPQPFSEFIDADYNDGFYLPFNSKLNGIPGELIDLRDETDTSEWFESTFPEIPESLTDYVNVYSFIKKFDVSRGEAEKALAAYIDGGQFTWEDIDTIFSSDIELITKTFASYYAIVKGEKIYSPEWLYTHSEKDYEAAGITPDDIKEKAVLYSDFYLSQEACAAFSAKLSNFTGEQIKIEPALEDANAGSNETGQEELEDEAVEDLGADIIDEIAEEVL